MKAALRALSTGWKLFSGVAVILGAVTAAMYFLPSATVDVGDLTDPSDLFSAQITVKNDGVVALDDVQVMLGICEIDIATAPTPESRKRCQSMRQIGSFAVFPNWHHHKMSAGEKVTLSFHDAIPNTDVLFADISVAVEYRPWYWPFGHQTRQFRLVGDRNAQQRYEWRFRPVDD
ncbi:hypothetical protein [Paraburkholderia sp. MM6662-R1]|uniref:hypothetical protein n=1 Tax=Paraburkholderia sp. MM6662-R1 TaxID=2991066 RepID=UPI003D1E63A1